jgi:hypothetical protein
MNRSQKVGISFMLLSILIAVIYQDASAYIFSLGLFGFGMFSFIVSDNKNEHSS